MIQFEPYKYETNIPTEKCEECGLIVIPIAGKVEDEENETTLVYRCPADDHTWVRTVVGLIEAFKE